LECPTVLLRHHRVLPAYTLHVAHGHHGFPGVPDVACLRRRQPHVLLAEVVVATVAEVLVVATVAEVDVAGVVALPPELRWT
jgi:hypothetical protein